MSEVSRHVYAGVKMTCNLLSDMELNAICMVALMGADPRHVVGYDKAKLLFTEANGTKMHTTALDALVLVHDERFGTERHVDEDLETLEANATTDL